jgi:hypothetical protein
MTKKQLSENEKLAYGRGVVAGIAIACGIVSRTFGEDVAVEEVLRATNLDTRKKLKDGGADAYDIRCLHSVLKHMAE